MKTFVLGVLILLAGFALVPGFAGGFAVGALILLASIVLARALA
jgi:hypothetical protein